jgi:hypothetical protein
MNGKEKPLEFSMVEPPHGKDPQRAFEYKLAMG